MLEAVHLRFRVWVGIRGTSAIDSLIAYAGGILCSVSDHCGPDQTGPTYASALASISTSYVLLHTAELTSVPLPAALPLFATRLGALGLLGWRRKWNATVAN